MLIVSVMGGMVLGFIWDIYRLIRHYIKFGSAVTALGDIAYWIVSAKLSLDLIFYISYGNVRMFILVGFISGALLYFYGISRYVLKAIIYVIDFIFSVVRKFLSFIVSPLKFLWSKLKIALLPVRIKIKKAEDGAKKRYKFFKFRIKKVFKNKKMYYNKRAKEKRMKSLRKGEQKRIERGSKDNRAEKKNKQRRLQRARKESQRRKQKEKA
jgi:spore cortex biosynthesis protein YabQ